MILQKCDRGKPLGWAGVACDAYVLFFHVISWLCHNKTRSQHLQGWGIDGWWQPASVCGGKEWLSLKTRSQQTGPLPNSYCFSWPWIVCFRGLDCLCSQGRTETSEPLKLWNSCCVPFCLVQTMSLYGVCSGNLILLIGHQLQA